MKRYIKMGLTCLTGILLTTSCDVMNTKPMESYDELLVWGTPETAEAFVSDAYSNIFALYSDDEKTGEGKNRFSYPLVEAYTPNCVRSFVDQLETFPTETGIDRYTDKALIFDQAKSFGLMRKCNMIIERVKVSTFPEAKKKEFIAEARFLRGFLFFLQTRWTGRIVPITNVLAPDDTEEFKTPLTKNEAESYKYILDDFKAAAIDLPETSPNGRANKYAAYAFISRAALQAYAYTKDEELLTTSINASNEVLNSGKYPLTSNYGDMFLEGGSKDPEIILGYYRLDQNTTVNSFENSMIGCLPNTPIDDVKQSGSTPLFNDPKAFEGWAAFFPSQELVDQYLVIDDVDGKAKPWNETSQYLRSVTEQSTASLKVGDLANLKVESAPTGPKHNVPEEADLGTNAKGNKVRAYGIVHDQSRINEIMYNKRDARFYGTIVYDSCVWFRELVTTCCQGNLWAANRKDQSDAWLTTATGYYWKKGVYDVSPRIYSGTKTNYHLVFARAGEMHLNLAEAYLLKKEFSKALTAINATRVKHGGLPASTATSEESLWKDYIRERRVEMALENDLYFSYLRWGKYGGAANEGQPAGAVIEALNKPVHKIQISKDRKKFFIGQVVRSGAWNRNFTVRRYLMPIPQGGLDTRAASGMIEDNNPGW